MTKISQNKSSHWSYFSLLCCTEKRLFPGLRDISRESRFSHTRKQRSVGSSRHRVYWDISLRAEQSLAVEKPELLAWQHKDNTHASVNKVSWYSRFVEVKWALRKFPRLFSLRLHCLHHDWSWLWSTVNRCRVVSEVDPSSHCTGHQHQTATRHRLLAHI